MSRKASIVVGLGYGDEGKGLATDYLCSQSARPLVIRFNGGQQAGHTVCMPDGRRHVFSSFGAGTLRGAATYWSAYCTFSLPAMLNEYRALSQIGAMPQLYLDRHCAVTTHYDVLYNRLQEQQRGNARHGSCGMGFGNTIQRHEAGTQLTVQDLLKPEQCVQKLIFIRNYYKAKSQAELQLDFSEFEHEPEDARFMNYIETFGTLLNQYFYITDEETILQSKQWETFVFEGAQGILLDMDFGRFPHVTRSYTTSRNALEIINRHKNLFSACELYYISRAYHTRHGEGPFNSAAYALQLTNNQQETNVVNEHQGNFRVGPLDLDQVRYALQVENTISKGLPKNLILTCFDQLDETHLPCLDDNVLTITDSYKLPLLIGYPFERVLNSRGPHADCITT
ncbi:adenylosuccinate synthetase [Mucilaginibacter lacusdianchii]|uniref:adenylosuccinate synthetase n=1 Tax=Mucilaginibacter lacusdianchii TaxID=2684211 RepID=UPI00131E9A77|nr:adenylosuccinate synthetase [Mucilaginibacter sp. JXJ CY 39]